MPTPDEAKQRVAALFDRIAPTYDAVDAEFFTPFGLHLVDHARLQSGWSVLDIGTGRGAVLRPASQAVGPDGLVHGLDLSPKMVEATSHDVKLEGLTNVLVEVGDAENPPLLGGGWDAITAGLVVFFLPDAPGALTTWRKILRPGGVFALSTFASDDPRWNPVFEFMRRYVPTEVPVAQIPPPGWHRGDDSVAATLSAAGFTGITSTTNVFTTRFRDADHWIDFSYSNGMRAYWESVTDPDEARDLRAGVVDAVESLREDNGQLAMHTGVRFTTARA